MKKKILIITGCFVLFLFALAPARLMENMLPANSPLSIAGVSGSLWGGHIEQLSANKVNLTDIDFAIGLLSLFSFDPVVNLDVGNGDIVGEMALHIGKDMPRDFHGEDMTLEMGSGVIEGSLPMRGIEIGGDIYTEAVEIIAQNNRLAYLSGLFHWRNAQINATGQMVTLGDFSINTETDEDSKTIRGEILASDNKLGLQGRISLTANGTFEFTGSVPTSIDQNLYNAMVLFNDGKPAQGRLPIKFKQKVY